MAKKKVASRAAAQPAVKKKWSGHKTAAESSARKTVTSKTRGVSAAKAKPAAATSKYQVKRGDTLWEVAQRFGTSIRSLMELNNLNESVIYAGQMLLVK